MITKLYTDFLQKVETTMVCNGFKAEVMEAEKLENTDYPHALPPGNPIKVFHVDALPGCPESWIKGPGSYVCPINVNKGLWFNWTMNDELNTSVITSIKGMNPITGQKISSLDLEQYDKECPKCKIEFKGERFCSKCGYKWPSQNYIASPNTLWWDGFRQTDGTVRQFFFSAEEARDIASYVIGKQNTVPAFGFAFYENIEKRKKQSFDRSFQFSYIYSKLSLTDSMSAPMSYNPYVTGMRNPKASGDPMSAPMSYNYSITFGTKCCSAEISSEKTAGISLGSIKDVSIGGGAEIKQDIIPDNLKVNQWQSKPSAIIRLYFVFKEEFDKIVNNGGIIDLNGRKEGFMQGLPLG